MSNTASIPVTKPYELGGAMAWFVWGLAVTFVVYYFSFQTGYAIVNPSVQKDVGLSVPQVATVAAVYTWVFARVPVPQRRLVGPIGCEENSSGFDRAGDPRHICVRQRRRATETLLLSQLIIAVGACSGFVGAGYIGGQWFGFAKFSFMFGLVQFAASFFSAFNQNLLNLALGHVAWRDLFNYVGFFGIALFVLGAIFIRNPTPLPKRASEGSAAFLSTLAEGIVEVAKVPHVWVAVCVWRIVLRHHARPGRGVGAQAVGRARVRCRDRKLGGLLVVVGTGGGLLHGPQVVRRGQDS